VLMKTFRSWVLEYRKAGPGMREPSSQTSSDSAGPARLTQIA
jgi:hypothetical protein